MKKKIIYLLGFLVLAFLASFIFYVINISVSNNLEQEREVKIESGSSLQMIAEKLKQEGIIDSKNLFFLYVKQKKKQAQLQAGTYVFPPSLNLKEVVARLVEGRVNKQEIRVQILEGWTNKDIENYLVNGLEVFEKDKWQQALKDFDTSEFDFLSKTAKDYSFEGYLFPDTYLISTSPEPDPKQLIRKMFLNFDRKVTEQMREDIVSQGKTLSEVITMASLVEKEAIMRADNDDARIIAGIFWSRIESGQALQSCASLAYILGEYKPVYSTEDTKIDSPYNTYLYPGLPPNPVSNPSILAIEAAIYPIETDYNYFLSPLGSDQTVFSKTYQEHLQNKRKYIDK
ncbi:MAG: endolytic transglycosylase MltG [Candidatus Pacebacteria bacterium]|nr:endolytic transglycosylase MltG [Candidatus Paceibacterota bacterium]